MSKNFIVPNSCNPKTVQWKEILRNVIQLRLQFRFRTFFLRFSYMHHDTLNIFLYVKCTQNIYWYIVTKLSTIYFNFLSWNVGHASRSSWLMLKHIPTFSPMQRDFNRWLINWNAIIQGRPSEFNTFCTSEYHIIYHIIYWS